MRHTLFKVLVLICLVIVFIVVIIVSLPSIIFQNIFGLDDGASFNDSYNDLSYSITDVIQEAYQDSLLSVDDTCSALGHVENGSNFAPEGVEEPALWLIDKASASINLKKKWGKKI